MNSESNRQFEILNRCRIIGLKKCLASGFKLTTLGKCRLKSLGKSRAIRKCWQEWVDSGRFQSHYGSGRPRATADREDRVIVRSAVTAPDSTLSTIRRVVQLIRASGLPPQEPNG
ncbi:hypothetical protein TNCV_1903661 [Trichonephila clavipes]|nr:hypothetical protein TNCV_1903661 [Trichonephila clavipes]